MKRSITLVASGWFVACAGAAAARDIAVSANDGEARIDDGVVSAVPNPPPDTVSVIDLSASPPKIIGSVNAPVSAGALPRHPTRGHALRTPGHTGRTGPQYEPNL